MNVESVVINNKTYLEIDKITVQDRTFVYLVNKDDENDFCIRKLKALDGKLFYESLNDNEEFDLAMMYFTKKHQNILTEDKN